VRALVEEGVYKTPGFVPLERKVSDDGIVNDTDTLNGFFDWLVKNQDKVCALVRLDFEAPCGTKIPVMSAYTNGKLTFDCMRHEKQVVDLQEIAYAVTKQKYTCTNVSEIVYWPPNQCKKGLFASYINKWYKGKAEAAGWPSGCVTQEQKETYIREFEEKNPGIKLDAANIRKSPAAKALAKLCLNSMWGKLAQRSNMWKYATFHLEKDSAEITKLLSDNKLVFMATMLKGKCLELKFRGAPGHELMANNTCVPLGVRTTSDARIRLIEGMSRLDPEQVLYCDTDSIVYKRKRCPIANAAAGWGIIELDTISLGGWTSEFADYDPSTQKICSFEPSNHFFGKKKWEKDLKTQWVAWRNANPEIKEISKVTVEADEAVFLGPKCYAINVVAHFTFNNGNTHVKLPITQIIKVKGFSLKNRYLDPQAPKHQITFDHMRRLAQKALLGESSETLSLTDLRFIRTSDFSVFVKNDVKRSFRFVFTKGMIDQENSTPKHIRVVPFGFYQSDKSLGVAVYTKQYAN
jgi:hypothetical protein